ncbi:MAG: hypothetical protein KIT83_03020 [Bryobacterales bacterium]|nr:hypothetical protein [Bryobacterales bacterium]
MLGDVNIVGPWEDGGLQTRLALHSTPLPEASELRHVEGAKEQAYQIARQFETLLIEEVIKSARVAGGGWLGDDADSTSESVAEMGEQFLARSIASAGGLGLAAQFAPLLHRDLTRVPALQSSPVPAVASAR